jgi:hypothetical protein
MQDGLKKLTVSNKKFVHWLGTGYPRVLKRENEPGWAAGITGRAWPAGLIAIGPGRAGPGRAGPTIELTKTGRAGLSDGRAGQGRA